MTTFLLCWYALGWTAIGLRRYAARNWDYIMQDLSYCEAFIIIFMGAVPFIVYGIEGIYFFSKNLPKCQKVKNWSPK